MSLHQYDGRDPTPTFLRTKEPSPTSLAFVPQFSVDAYFMLLDDFPGVKWAPECDPYSQGA
jgi:hypothetical protein